MKATTFYNETLDPLRIRALQVQERYEHATKKYRHDRTTQDGSMTVDRQMFLTVLKVLRRKLLVIEGWNLTTMVSEVEYEVEGDDRTMEMVLVLSEQPTIRVPAKAVIELVEGYRRYVVDGYHASDSEPALVWWTLKKREASCVEQRLGVLRHGMYW